MLAVGAVLLAPAARADEDPAFDAAAHAASVGAGAQWPVPGGDSQGTRYSKLTDITAANVATLVADFTVPTGQAGSHEGQPLVVGTVMYMVTPFPHRLIALDLAHGGETLWTYTPPSVLAARGVACCDVVNRGASYASGKLVFNTLDDTTIAVNAATGKEVWRKRFAGPASGMTLTGAPIVADGVVMVGNAGGEFGVRGWVIGLDLATGAQLWQAYATGSDIDTLIGKGFRAFYKKDQGVNLGAKTWPGTTWKQGGSTAWSWLTYDPELDLLFYGTDNPGVWNPDMRVGDNKWSATVFARKPKTGAAVWAYQLTPHDGWDFDAISENIPVDLTFAGKPRKLLVQFDKNGFAYTWDRTTGQVLVAKPYVPVTWSTGVNLATGVAALVASKQPHTGKLTSGVCPSPLGGKDYQPSAFSPVTNLFYVPTNNLCDSVEPLEAIYIKGAPFMGVSTTTVPGAGGNLGALIAWDPLKGEKRWSVKEALPIFSGVLATAGDLVFYGTLDKHFKALDAKTGKLLFDTSFACGIAGDPISFTGADGKQRIAVYSGIGWLAGAFTPGGSCPAENPEGGGGVGGELHVFRLP